MDLISDDPSSFPKINTKDKIKYKRDKDQENTKKR